jgi:hypothetical protein
MVPEGHEVRRSGGLHPTQPLLIAMTPDPDFVHHHKITMDDLVGGKPVARRAGSSRSHDVIVTVMLLALLVVAIVTRATISDEIAGSNVTRQSYVALVIDAVAALGLSVGLAWLLFSGRPRADNDGARRRILA